MVGKIRWGDTLDEEETGIPQNRVIGPDANGVKTVIEYKRNEKGDIMKCTTKTKTELVTRKVYKVRRRCLNKPVHGTCRGCGSLRWFANQRARLVVLSLLHRAGALAREERKLHPLAFSSRQGIRRATSPLRP